MHLQWRTGDADSRDQLAGWHLDAGDTLVDFGKGFQIADWLRESVTREQVADGLRPLLELPVELVLPAHGAPTDRAALERALS
jgi:hypothetical protein